jgi:hypothetical protein
MIYAFLFYWVVSGMALYFWLPVGRHQSGFELVMSFLFGGFAVPALFIAKVLK